MSCCANKQVNKLQEQVKQKIVKKDDVIKLLLGVKIEPNVPKKDTKDN